METGENLAGLIVRLCKDKTKQGRRGINLGFLVGVIWFMSDSSKQEETQDTEGFGRLV